MVIDIKVVNSAYKLAYVAAYALTLVDSNVWQMTSSSGKENLQNLLRAFIKHFLKRILAAAQGERLS